MTYVPKTEQFKHQETTLNASWDLEGYALWWQQRCGKSKGLIDNAAMLYEADKIDGMFLLAPNGLHRNFVTKEIAKHLPDRITEKALSVFYRTDRSETVWHKDEIAKLMKPGGFPIFTMSYDGIMTEPGRRAAKQFLTTHRCLYGLDESQRIKNMDAARTERVLASAPFAPYRRILTGTPVSQAPWDTYPQIQFLDSTFWAKQGMGTVEAMKSRYGLWDRTVRRVRPGVAQFMERKTKDFPDELKNKIVRNRDTGKAAIKEGMALVRVPIQARNEDNVPKYRNLGELRSMLEPIRSRVLKRDVFDLPPMLMSTLEYELSPAQQQAYDDLRERGFTEIERGVVTVNMAMTLMLRLQQIVCGYLPCEGDGETAPFLHRFPNNPRLELLGEIAEDENNQGIIWARFRSDIDQICDLLTKKGKTFARYDGTLSDDDCARNEDRFHAGDAQWFVANQAKGGEGLDLTEALTMVYYSNNFKLIDRLQSIERPYGPAQKFSVGCIDLVAAHTIDERLCDVLQAKSDVANLVVGDAMRNLFAISPRQGRLL